MPICRFITVRIVYSASRKGASFTGKSKKTGSIGDLPEDLNITKVITTHNKTLSYVS